jgi:hypothetical protein
MVVTSDVLFVFLCEVWRMIHRMNVRCLCFPSIKNPMGNFHNIRGRLQEENRDSNASQKQQNNNEFG